MLYILKKFMISFDAKKIKNEITHHSISNAFSKHSLMFYTKKIKRKLVKNVYE